MKSEKIVARLPKGTRDFNSVEVKQRKYISNIIESVFMQYGFEPLQTPTFEYTDVLMGKYEENNKLIYSISNNQEDDPECGKNFGFGTKSLKYDLTVPLARYISMNRNIKFPFKRYQIQNVFRGDRPQKGRYREFTQCDVDIVGSKSLYNELDLMSIYAEVFAKLGLNYTIKINNRKILSEISDMFGLDFDQFISVLDKSTRIVDADNAELEKLLKAKTLDDVAGILGETEGVKELRWVLDRLKVPNRYPNSNINFEFDVLLARGLDYYTGTIFEVVSNDSSMKSSIGGGGRYDNLTEMFGVKGITGVGISFGLDRIYDVMSELKKLPTFKQKTTKILFCVVGEESLDWAYENMKEVRGLIPCEMWSDPCRVKKQLDYANELGIPYVVIVGESEVRDKTLTLKDMSTGTQEVLTSQQLLMKFHLEKFCR